MKFIEIMEPIYWNDETRNGEARVEIVRVDCIKKIYMTNGSKGCGITFEVYENGGVRNYTEEFKSVSLKQRRWDDLKKALGVSDGTKYCTVEVDDGNL